VEFLDINRKDPGFPRVKLRVNNHSNKAIRSVEMRLFFLDDSGKQLEDSRASHSDRQPVAPRNGQKEVEVNAFFMPEQTKTVTL
jgi:hypothetical protein